MLEAYSSDPGRKTFHFEKILLRRKDPWAIRNFGVIIRDRKIFQCLYQLNGER